jgi:hypothetical protein
MRKNAGLILFFIFFTSVSAAPAFSAEEKDGWTAADTASQSLFIALTIIDWRQTREFTGNPHKYPDLVETNPVMGPHPSARRVNSIMGASIAVHTLTAVLLPKPYRTIWQWVWIGAEIKCIRTNYRAGVSFHF